MTNDLLKHVRDEVLFVLQNARDEDSGNFRVHKRGAKLIMTCPDTGRKFNVSIVERKPKTKS